MGFRIEKKDLKHLNIKKLILFNQDSQFAYALTHLAEIIKLNLITLEKEYLITFTKELLDTDLSIRLSQEDTYIALFNTYGQYGEVYNLKKKKMILRLDRGKYHIDVSQFPVQFLYIDKKDYLIYGTDWNRIDLLELEKEKIVTPRNILDEKFTEKEIENYSLDYFYGRVYASPSSQYIVSSGWVWHPISVFKFLNIQEWFKNPFHAELSDDADFSIWSYYWDRAGCWKNDHIFAYIYDAREEDLSESEDIGTKTLDPRKQYVVYYDVHQQKKVDIIEVNYPVNEYFEGFNTHLFLGKYVYLTFDKGLKIIDPQSGDILFEDATLKLNKFHVKSEILYRFKHDELILLHID